LIVVSAEKKLLTSTTRGSCPLKLALSPVAKLPGGEPPHWQAKGKNVTLT